MAIKKHGEGIVLTWVGHWTVLQGIHGPYVDLIFWNKGQPPMFNDLTAPRHVDSLVVQTSAGPVRGIRDGQVSAFHAVPYAAAPVGSLRFAAPEDPQPWAEARDCTQPGPSAPQNASRLDAVMGISKFSQSEDCLNVSIWTPAADGRKRPVFVWIHGGAYMSGGGDQSFYTGGQLANRGDIVVVNLTFRLGVLGYLYAPGIGANRGLLDQIHALKWIHANIANFGGDPHAITVGGQSAGGGSLMALLVHPASAGLIRRAIVQSAPGQCLTIVQAREVSTLFFAKAGLREDDIVGLRALEIPKILAVQSAVVMDYAARAGRLLPFQLVAGQPDVPDQPAKGIGGGSAPDVAMMLGWTRDEMHAWFAQDANFTSVTALEDLAKFPAGKDLPESTWEQLRHSTAADAKPWEALGQLLSEQVFGSVAKSIADSRTSRGCETYVYRFDWRPTPKSKYGACHCIEIPFMFGNFAGWPISPMLEGANPEVLREVTNAVQAGWIGFVRTGKPGGGVLPNWPARSANKRAVMVFDERTHIEDH